MKLTKESKIIAGIYAVLLVFWIVLTVATKHTAVTEGFLFDWVLKLFHFTGDVMFVVGGIFGITKAFKWGGVKSAMGRAVFAISLGLTTWGVGSLIWFWYLFYGNIEVPYPSIADVAYILSWPLWGYGVWSLSKVVGARSAIRTSGGKLLLLIVPIITVSLSYYLLIVVARGGVIDLEGGLVKVFFDLFYPIGSMAIFTLVGVVYSLSQKFLGGRYKVPILLLFIGFIVNFIADFIFSYTTTLETYFNGNITDLLFATAMFFVATALTNLDPALSTERKSVREKP